MNIYQPGQSPRDADKQLDFLAHAETQSALRNILRGIEKEGLRVERNSGQLAMTPHPRGLGSALTNSWVTTDFSESLLEFITPAFPSVSESLEYLQAVHSVAAEQMQNEIIWSASMPCALPADEKIPLAEYGSSNIARMKTAYRRGLGHRYGRAMQTVAGIHYNFSLPDRYWAMEADFYGQLFTQHYTSQRYLDLIRNFRRNYWLLIYLFGASPCVDPSFVQGRSHKLCTSDNGDLYLPDATSLRMGDLGYQSVAQKSLFICYNELDSYIKTLDEAMHTPYPPYNIFGTKQNGVYQQLSTALLQIENEFYSPIRPKRVTESEEKPLQALNRRGVEYIEVRCLDISPFGPLGIDQEMILFLDTFLLSCLSFDSPLCNEQEFAQIGENQLRVVNQGRDPALQIFADNQQKPLSEQGKFLLEQMMPVAVKLDESHATNDYSAAVRRQLEKIENTDATPSARLLRQLESQQCRFVDYISTVSTGYFEQHKSVPVDTARRADLKNAAAQSHEQQLSMENVETQNFDDFLTSYFQASS